MLEHFQLQPLVKISLYILNLPLHQTCQEAIASEQCVLNRSVSSSHDILVEFTRPDLTAVATVKIAQNVFSIPTIVPTPSPLFVLESAVTMATVPFF